MPAFRRDGLLLLSTVSPARIVGAWSVPDRLHSLLREQNEAFCNIGRPDSPSILRRVAQ